MEDSIRHGKPGRPVVPKEIRELIRTMSRENPLWGAPRIYGELLQLGIEIGETSVSQYMVRRRRPPSQTWKTFLGIPVKADHRSGLKPITIPLVNRISIPD